MKNIITLTLSLFITIALTGQEKDYLYFLETDDTWRKELFLFPINFAPDIKYQGHEDARFPDGWEDQNSANFWSYAFAWNLKESGSIAESDIEANLQKYFNGLMRWDQTSVNMTKKEATENVAISSNH